MIKKIVLLIAVLGCFMAVFAWGATPVKMMKLQPAQKMQSVQNKESPPLAAESRAMGSPEGSNAMLPSGRRPRGFAAQAKSIQKTISAACGRVVEVPTQDTPTYTVTLSSNATTGYSWFIKSYNSHWLTLQSHQYIAPQTNRVGAGGYEKWVFAPTPDALKARHVIPVTFIYARSWELTSGTAKNLQNKESLPLAAESRAMGSPEGSNAMLPSGRRPRGFPAQAKSIKETISAAGGRVVETKTVNIVT